MSSSPEAVIELFTAMPVPQLMAGSAPAPLGRAESSASRAAGFAAGYAEGLRQASARSVAAERAQLALDEASARDRAAATARAAGAVERAARRLGEVSDGIIEAMADALAEEVVSLAEAVIQAELTDPGHRAAAALRRALSGAADRLGGGHAVVVRLNPADVAALDPAATTGVQIVADTSVAPGDATAISGDRWIDARLRQTLERARAAVTG